MIHLLQSDRNKLSLFWVVTDVVKHFYLVYIYLLVYSYSLLILTQSIKNVPPLKTDPGTSQPQVYCKYFVFVLNAPSPIMKLNRMFQQQTQHVF